MMRKRKLIYDKFEAIHTLLEETDAMSVAELEMALEALIITASRHVR